MRIEWPTLACVLLIGCGDPMDPESAPRRLAIHVPDGFEAVVYADGLNLPTSLAWAPDGSGRLFVNELQSGRIRIIDNGTLLDSAFAKVPTFASGGFPISGENGLIGIAFDPDFVTNGYVYVTFATRHPSTTLGTVARFTAVGNVGQDLTILLDSIPAGSGHQVQSLAFGPDGKLYVSVGDAWRSALAQDTASALGKVLRMNADGSVPADNPFPGSLVFARGLRNAFDFAFDQSGQLYLGDNGTDRTDEFNRIEPGANYGWPHVLGMGQDTAYVDPVHVWPQIVAPGGMIRYGGNVFPPAYYDKLFLVLFGDTYAEGPSDRAKRIQTVDTRFDPPVFEDFAVYNFPFLGNPLDLAEGPDGFIYLTDIFQGRVFAIGPEP